jgi:hypothetical protein
MNQIDQERFDKVFEEMREERDERHPYLSGHARLMADYNLRQAILEGAERWEKEKAQESFRLSKTNRRKKGILKGIFGGKI